jgi:flagellar hook protein FlgE
MSLLGSLSTAVQGMNAQSAALSSISNNVANSQTIGFKETDTSFVEHLTDSDASAYTSGTVAAQANYTNSEQGAVTTSTDPTSLAISGGGFFAVQRPSGDASTTGATSFSAQPYYTRVGDFTPNTNGYLVNSTGYALDGWTAANAAGTQFNTTSLQPLQISKAPSPPVPTSQIDVAANIPSAPAAGTSSYSSVVPVIDAGGNSHNLTMTWTQTLTDGSSVSATNPATTANPVKANQWNLTVASDSGATQGPLLVTFGTNASDAGTIQSITSSDPSAVAPATQTTGSAATVALNLNLGLGAQPVTLNLGQFGGTSGITQFAGTDYQVTSQTQNGLAQGNYSSVSIQASGNVVINYDNGQTATVGKIPLVAFNDPNGLQQQDGQTFTATVDSGQPTVVAAGTSGTGTLTVGAEEGSNVDIATQFTQMIVAQRAYTANTKVISTSNEMLQDTLNMIQG